MSKSASGARWALRQVGLESDRVLAELWTSTFRDAYSSVHTSFDLEAYCIANYSVERAQDLLTDSCHSCKLAYREQTPIGLYVLKRHQCPIPLQGETTELKQLYVLKSEYGSGLGHVLMNDAITTAQALGTEHLWLAVADTNKRAQAFYSKYGFAAVGPGPIFEVGAHGLTSTILALDLTEVLSPSS